MGRASLTLQAAEDLPAGASVTVLCSSDDYDDQVNAEVTLTAMKITNLYDFSN